MLGLQAMMLNFKAQVSTVQARVDEAKAKLQDLAQLTKAIKKVWNISRYTLENKAMGFNVSWSIHHAGAWYPNMDFNFQQYVLGRL